MANRKAKILIDGQSLALGFINTNQGTNGNRRIGVDGQYVDGEMTLFRRGFEGQISPAFVFNAITDTAIAVVDYAVNAAVAPGSNGPIWNILQNGKIVKFDLDDDTVDQTRTAISPPAGTLATGQDIILYKDGSNNQRLFASYSYLDTTYKGDITVFDAAGANIDDDFFSSKSSTLLGVSSSSTAPLKMWIGPDDILYCTNGRYIASYDSLSDAANSEAFDGGLQFIFTSGTKYNNYNVFVGYQDSTFVLGSNFDNTKGTVKVIFWDGFSPVANQIYELEDYVSGAIYATNNDLYIFTYGKGDTAKCWKFNGTGFDKQPLFEWGTHSSGIIPTHGQVEWFRNHLVFPTYINGFISLAAYGSPDDRIYQQGLHRITASQNNSQVGFLRELRGNVLYRSYFTGSSYQITKLDETYFGTLRLSTRQYRLPYNSTIEAINVYFAYFSVPNNFITMSVLATKNFLDSTTSIGQFDITNTDVSTKNYHSVKTSIPGCQSFGLQLSVGAGFNAGDGAVIDRIEVIYSYDDEDY